MSQYDIRQARLEDADRIRDICESALGYRNAPEAVRVQLARVLKRPGDRVYVACDAAQDRVVGLLHASDYETLYHGSMKHIVLLGVDADARGHGLGRRLLAEAENWAREEGCQAVMLVSGVDRVAAHAFYQHCGYTLRKEQKNFIRYLQAKENPVPGE